jgi:hypothetical protein
VYVFYKSIFYEKEKLKIEEYSDLSEFRESSMLGDASMNHPESNEKEIKPIGPMKKPPVK